MSIVANEKGDMQMRKLAAVTGPDVLTGHMNGEQATELGVIYCK